MMQVAVMIVAFLGSLLFQFQKNSSELLYFYGNSSSCTTSSEWTWIAVTGSLSLLLHMKPTKRCLDLPSEQAKSQLLLWFLAMNLLWFSAAISEIQFSFSAVKMVEFLGAKAAWPGLWNLAFVVFPVKRSSEILALSHKDTLFLHIWAGQSVFFWLTVHTVFLSFAYAVNYEYSVREWINVMVPSANSLYTEGVVNFMGWLGLAMFLLLWLTSRPWFRKHFYETFSFLHLVTAALFVFFSNLHDYNTIHFIQPAFAAWIAERLVRRVSTVNVSVYHGLTSTSVTDGIQSNGGILAISACTTSGTNDLLPLVSMTMTLPPSWNVVPGTVAFLYLKCPSISGWQLHPFSISAIDTDNMTFSLHIKALGDWTNRFVQQMSKFAIQPQSQHDSRDTCLTERNETGATCRSHNTAMFNMCIEGPYHSDLGAPSDSDQKCLFLAGGVGLTGLSEVLYRRHSRGQAIQLVWMLRTIEEMEFLAKDLLDRLNPPRDTTRIIVFITRQKERHRSAQTVKVNHPQLLEANCSRLLDGDQVAADSFMTFPTTIEESRRYPSMRTMTLVSLLGVAFSFLLARMICCNRTGRDIESGKILHICSAVPRASTTTTCSNSCQQDGAPCCTTPICFYCFRGLPVLFMLFLAPMVPFLFAKMYPYGFYVVRWLRRSIRFYRASSRHGNCATPLQAVSTIEDAFEVPVACGNEMNQSSALKHCLPHHCAPASMINLHHTSIEYRKPVLSEIVEDFCASLGTRSENHDLFSSNDISDAESNQYNKETKEAAVFVCGSKALAESVLHEVEIHNGSEDRSSYRHGALESSRRVRLSVWTATGAY